MKVKKNLVILGLTGAMLCSLLAGCGNNGETAGNKETINVISREDGSGTRSAFIELFGIEQKDENGEKVDHTTDTAAVTNSTAVMIQSVAGDVNSIGYISLGSMDDAANIKAVQIDGAAATVENIKNGTYKISRPFNIVTKETVSEAAQDFIDFIMSADGQAVIELQQSDSSTGVSNTIDGTCDIGMASRELKDSEVENGVSSTVIAMDGIAVIVNGENSISGLTNGQVMDIFTGSVTSWSDVAAQ